MKVSAVLITREPQWPDDAPAMFDFDETIVETNCPGIHRRFELALGARNDHVYVQDDDCVIDIPELLGWYDGEHLTNAITAYHLGQYAGTGVTLIGFGCFFPKRLIDFSRWDRHYGRAAIPAGEDDRVFTYLAQPHHSKCLPIREIRRPVAMCAESDHYRKRDRVFEMLRQLPKEDGR